MKFYFLGSQMRAVLFPHALPFPFSHQRTSQNTQYLDTFWIITTWGCYWHPVSIIRRLLNILQYTEQSPQDSFHNKEFSRFKSPICRDWWCASHNHVHPLIYLLWLSLCFHASVEQLWQRCYSLQSPIFYSLVLYRKDALRPEIN